MGHAKKRPIEEENKNKTVAFGSGLYRLHSWRILGKTADWSESIDAPNNVRVNL